MTDTDFLHSGPLVAAPRLVKKKVEKKGTVHDQIVDR